METRYIYLLKNPETGNGFYIGQCKNLISRLLNHLVKCEKSISKKDEIIRNIKKSGSIPIIEKLESILIDGSSLSLEKLSEREKYWITHYRDIYELYNTEHNMQPSLKKTPESKLCKRCKDVFYPNKPKQVFCSAKCRVYFSREEKIPVTNNVEFPKDFLDTVKIGILDVDGSVKPLDLKREKIVKKVMSELQTEIREKKQMPEGLDKFQKLRWLRENG